MLRIIIVSIVLALCTEPLFSQPDADRKLLLLEKEIFFSSSDSEKTNAMLNKLGYYLASNNFNSDALAEVKRIHHSSIYNSDSQRRFLWTACLLYYFNDEKDKSLSYYSLYQRMFPDSGITSEILGALVNSGYDAQETKKIILKLSEKDSSLACLSCLHSINEYKRPHKKFYVAASAILPGSGTMLNGNVLKGFNSLALNSSAGVVTYLLIKNNLYANAVLLGGAMFLKFYSGNIRLTRVLFDRKEADKKNTLANDCERNLKKVLEKYPVEFK